MAITPVSGDASFRRYFRTLHNGTPVILMDAPPDKEDSRPFLDVDHRLRQAGLRAPQVLAFDLNQGFGLLEDFGDQLYRDVIDEQSVDQLFPGLFDTLAGMATDVDHTELPVYDQGRLQQEMDLYTEWYLARHKGVTLAPGKILDWQQACGLLIQSALSQPQVFVHRDFHSCNLLLTEELTGLRDQPTDQSPVPGIIDFQDAVTGPLTYDFASLLWDRYIRWPRHQLETWMMQFHHLLESRMDFNLDHGLWIRWCDLMGLQRNLKIVGIFARLHYRDGKTGYLEMIPQFHRYLLDVLPNYPELSGLHRIVRDSACAP